MDDFKQKPSGCFYGLGCLVGILGVIGFAAILVYGLSGLTNKLQQVVMPGTHEIKLDEAGTYTVFHEHKSVVDNKVYAGPASISGLQCAIKSKGGDEIPVTGSSMSSNYTVGSRSGYSIYEFTIQTPGTYTLTASYADGREEPKVVLAIGASFMKSLLFSIFGCIGALLFGSVLSIVIIVVTYIKRRDVHATPRDA